jgi:hypothetical protein
MKTQDIFRLGISALAALALGSSLAYATTAFTTRDQVNAKVKMAMDQLYRGLKANAANDGPTLAAIKSAILGVDLKMEPSTYDAQHPPEALIIGPGDLKFGTPYVRADRSVVIPILK